MTVDSELHDVVRRARDLAPSSRARYLRDLDQWIEFAGVDPSGWTPLRAQAFYDQLLDEKELRPQSANRLMASVRYASKWWAHRKGTNALDFAFVHKANATDKIKKRALTQEQTERLLLTLKAEAREGNPNAMRDFAIIVTLLETGMRKMSLRSMTIERTIVDASHVATTGSRYPLTWVKLKGGGNEDFSVPLSDTAILAMTLWLGWLGHRGLTHGPLFRALDKRIGPQGAYLAASKTALSETAINRLLDQRAIAAGIGHIYPHQFRHTFVTWRADAKLSPHEIAAMTGHTLSGLGAMAGYIDMNAIAERIRNSTPDWLRELVAS